MVEPDGRSADSRSKMEHARKRTLLRTKDTRARTRSPGGSAPGKPFRKEPRDLGAAVRTFAGRDHAGAHSALADSIAAAEVLAGQLTRYDDLPRDIAALAAFTAPIEGRWVDADKRFVWRDGAAVFNFGAKRGQLLADVAAKSPEYLDWMLEADFPDEAKRIVREAREGRFPTRR